MGRKEVMGGKTETIVVVLAGSAGQRLLGGCCRGPLLMPGWPISWIASSTPSPLHLYKAVVLFISVDQKDQEMRFDSLRFSE
jgi:hypothetical protein